MHQLRFAAGFGDQKCSQERISLAMASDVRPALLPEDTRASFIGASFDFKAAALRRADAREQLALIVVFFRNITVPGLLHLVRVEHKISVSKQSSSRP